MAQDHHIEQIFRALLDALNRGDDEGAVAYFAEDGVVVDYSDPTVVHEGRDAVGAVIRGFREMYPDMTVELLNVVSDESRLAAELMLRGTPAGRSEPTEMQYCMFYSFEEGEIVSEHFYADSRRLAGEA